VSLDNDRGVGGDEDRLRQLQSRHGPKPWELMVPLEAKSVDMAMHEGGMVLEHYWLGFGGGVGVAGTVTSTTTWPERRGGGAGRKRGVVMPPKKGSIGRGVARQGTEQQFKGNRDRKGARLVAMRLG